MAQTRFEVSTIAVQPVGTAGTSTKIVSAQSYDQRVYLWAAGPGIYVCHHGFRLSSEGAALPTNYWTQFDIPAGAELWGLSIMGVVQVSRTISSIPADSGLADLNTKLTFLLTSVNSTLCSVQRAISALTAKLGA